MSSGLRPLVAPVYLFACVLLGCSGQPGWPDLLLDVAGIVVVVWALASPTAEPLEAPARQILLLVTVTLAFVLLQLIPLPDALWLRLAPLVGGTARHLVSHIAVTPDRSVITLLAIIPPLATFCAIVRLGPVRVSSLVIAFVAGALVSVVVTLLALAGQAGAPYHPLPKGSLGAWAPLFENRSHVVALFLTSIPFIAAIPAARDRRNSDHRSGLLLISAGLGAIMVITVALAGTVASYILALPVIAGSMAVALPPKSVLRRSAALAATLLALAAMAVLTIITPVPGETRQKFQSAVQAQHLPLRFTADMIANAMPFGSGLGSFPHVFARYDHAAGPASTGVVHANDDYAEVAVELGAPGMILICLFLAWWAAALRSVWRDFSRNSFARAASVSSALILVQSLVDVPLRVTAVAAVFAMCIALLAQRRAPSRPRRPDLRPTRHLVVE